MDAVALTVIDGDRLPCEVYKVYYVSRSRFTGQGCVLSKFNLNPNFHHYIQEQFADSLDLVSRTWFVSV